ncbi:MAG: 2-dehydropantoate 2-reductase [Xanthomonadales bacterium]|nr:2-dehydropantoate 2-reductase [Xanthomonadales bacterium]
MASVCVLGAGSIGCYVGGRLAAAGANVTLVGRPRIGEEVASYGLRISDLHGAEITVSPDQLDFRTELGQSAEHQLVLVTVKSAATAEVGPLLARALRPGTVVISLQNGVGNADVLARSLAEQTVLSGMVPFNVVQGGEGRFHQGSEGTLEVEEHPALKVWLELFSRAGLDLKRHAQMLPVQWAKLLLNLNNPVNALSDLPLKCQLAKRDYRRCVGLAQSEALGLLDLAGIRPAKLTAVPARWVPRVLNLPDWLFARVANRMLEIDPLARSSMWEDLVAGRVTEVDWINGEIVRLAERLGRQAPVNAKLMALIREAEAGGARDWSGSALLAALKEVAE